MANILRAIVGKTPPDYDASRTSEGTYCSMVWVAQFVPRGYRRQLVQQFLQRIWSEEHGQDVAEYAVMLAVVLVIVVGTIRLIGANANNVFSSVSSSIAQ